MAFRELYKAYLDTLDEIAQRHDELTDTDVRERLHEVINWYFIWGKPIDSDLPLRYAMFSPEGDRLVAQATTGFLEQARRTASGVAVGADRNLLIEDESVRTRSGEPFDRYLGSAETVLPAEKPGGDALYGDYDD